MALGCCAQAARKQSESIELKVRMLQSWTAVPHPPPSSHPMFLGAVVVVGPWGDGILDVSKESSILGESWWC